jgi:hypothetical protein
MAVTMKPELTIDAEFQLLISPLSAQEFDSLTQQILEKGCLEPLYIWKDGDKRILLDGHNRHRICSEYNLPFTFVKVPLASREEAKLWILLHQIGRRNLSDDQRATMWNDIRELRSKLVQAEKLKKARGARADILISAKSTEIEAAKKDTRAEIAKEAKLPESKLRQAQTLKTLHPELYKKVRGGAATLRDARKELSRTQKSTRVQKDRDYFCRIGRALDGVFKGTVKEKLEDLVRVNPEDITPVTENGLQQIIAVLEDVSMSAGSYATKFKAILQSKNKAA